MMKTILRSKELTCPSCSARIEKAVKALDGVQDAQVHFNTGKIEVVHDPVLVKGEDLEKAILNAGYTAHVSAY
ncbi:MAG: heavy-metal-associated domain-containing protein [Chloroflexi bacterium]|nr:heavy-metal-associated domain-containing protein [Chloroflexota bacterium]